MVSWQAAQTMRVLRRLVAMSTAHGGWPGPGCPRLASLRTWCTCTLPGSPHSSHRCVKSRWISSLRGWGAGFGIRSWRTASLSRTRGIPPNRATRSGLPLRWILASKQVRSPYRVVILAWYLVAIFDTGGLMLGCQGLQHRRQGVPAQFIEPPDVVGEPVVADDASVFGPERGDDVVVVQVLQGRPVPGFAVAPVGGTFGLDHVQRYS